MILIVDSGSTKTDWIAINEEGKQLFQTQTLGLNPAVLSSEIINERIHNNFELYQKRHEVTHVFFYGAGCGTPKPPQMLKEVFQKYFDNAEIDVKEDTYAAIYATTTPGEKSIVCILGTGSNCTYFDGNEAIQKVVSLGYILMDDCSGNYFGRQLIRDYYFHKIPKELADKFANTYDLTADYIKRNLYKEPNPNTYLATFAKFLIQNKDHEYSQGLIKKGMQLFINNQIEQFADAKQVPTHFIGSIAFYLQDELKEVLAENNLKIGNIFRRPIEGLVKYHVDLAAKTA